MCRKQPKSEEWCIPGPHKRHHSKRVAAIVVNYNMVERANSIAEGIKKHVKWPVDIIGKPKSIENLWKTLKLKEHEFTKLFDEFVPKESSEYISFFKGDNQFASEISFAYFLNAAGIPFNDCISLRGFLYSDRGQCQ